MRIAFIGWTQPCPWLFPWSFSSAAMNNTNHASSVSVVRPTQRSLMLSGKTNKEHKNKKKKECTLNVLDASWEPSSNFYMDENASCQCKTCSMKKASLGKRWKLNIVQTYSVPHLLATTCNFICFNFLCHPCLGCCVLLLVVLNINSL